jgi:hypothetical protein
LGVYRISLATSKTRTNNRWGDKMQTIIDFIFDNIYILIIAFFALSSLLGKKRQAGEEQQRREPRTTATRSEMNERPRVERREPQPQLPRRGMMMPPFGGNQPMGGGWTEEVLVKRQPKEETYDTLGQLEGPAIPIEDQIGGSSPIEDSSIGTGTKATAFAKSDSINSLPNVNFQNLSTRQVVQGMVWSEIFGSPRSKRPYRPRTYR